MPMQMQQIAENLPGVMFSFLHNPQYNPQYNPSSFRDNFAFEILSKSFGKAFFAWRFILNGILF